MNWSQSMWERLVRFVREPASEVNRTQRAFKYGAELAYYGYQQLIHDRAAQMAAALTYHTLFSLLPTIVLALVVMHAFVSDVQIEQLKDSTVSWVLQWLEDASQAPDGAAAADQSQKEFINVAQNLDDQIQGWLNRLEQVSFRGIGVVGVLLFIWAATALLRTIERSFNLIYGGSSSRPWYVRVPLYYTVITLGPLVLLLGQYMQEQFISFLKAGGVTDFLAYPVVVLSPLVTAWVVLWLVYVLLPNTKVSVRAAAIGSLVSALGTVVAIEAFSLYVKGAVATKIYGALALPILFMLWLWITWVIVLFGLELSYVIQGIGAGTFQRQRMLDEPEMIVDPHALVPMLALVGQQFESGGTIEAVELSRRMGLPVRVVEKLAEHLRGAGLVHQVGGGGEGVPTLTLARPPERISLEQILTAGRDISLNGERKDLPGVELLEKLGRAEADAAQGATLATAMRGASNQS